MYHSVSITRPWRIGVGVVGEYMLKFLVTLYRKIWSITSVLSRGTLTGSWALLRAVSWTGWPDSHALRNAASDVPGIRKPPAASPVPTKARRVTPRVGVRAIGSVPAPSLLSCQSLNVRGAPCAPPVTLAWRPPGGATEAGGAGGA